MGDSKTMPVDAFPLDGKQWMMEILGISLLSAIGSEAVSWVLIYRKDSYHRLVENLKKEQSKLDKKLEEDENGSSNRRGRSQKPMKEQAKYKRGDARIKEMHRELQTTRMSSMMVIAVVMIVVFSTLSQMYDAKVTAKLPFTPFGFIQGISHRNVPGEDMTDCSFVFLYALTSLAIRANLQKALGFTPPPSPPGGGL